MNKFEVRLEVFNNGNRSYVHTFLFADNALQARDLALAMIGVNGRIVFGPYPVN